MRVSIAVLLAGLLVACGPTTPRGEFGGYRPPFKHLRLAGGDSLTVYRVKRWTFTDGSAPALQLEYEPALAMGDTVQLRLLAERLWPAFRPYVEAMHLTTAIFTATHLETGGNVVPSAWMRHSFGFIAKRDSSGVWHWNGDEHLLPTSPTPDGAGIFEANGEPLDLSICAPAEACQQPNVR